MFTIFHNTTDSFGDTYQTSFTVATEAIARAHVAVLKSKGHYEAFYRAS